MECPKCHKKITENDITCPHCNKVLLLECPNCHSLNETGTCQECGYTILVKCSKCGKINHITKEACKCGFPVLTSLAYQECESDEFASITVSFNSLKAIKKSLKTKDLYAKFYFKLKNMLYSNIKSTDCKLIKYGDDFVINFNKELSFVTSVNKAVRLALKIMNSFVGLNVKIIDELGVPLNLVLTINKKTAEELLIAPNITTNIKTLNLKKGAKKYLKGLQIVLDQYARDELFKDYKTDSLYTVEDAGKTITYYEIILDSYVLYTEKKDEDNEFEIKRVNIKKTIADENDSINHDFKVFDINAKCSFKSTNAVNFIEELSNIDLNKNGKIISIKTTSDLAVEQNEIINFYKKNDYKIVRVNCSEELTYKPWGVFETIFKEFYNLPFHKSFIEVTNSNQNAFNVFKPIVNFIKNIPLKAASSEDARYAYIEQWNKLLKIMKQTVIIIDGFEYIDDTTLQTLELYFDKYRNVVPNFLFITNLKNPVHSKIKGLLRTNLYTEFTMEKANINACLETLKIDATDFIQSFYFEKIQENFNGSYLYFKNALRYLEETGAITTFENKLLVQNSKTVVLPKGIKEIYKERLKRISKKQDEAFILAYTTLLGSRLDLKTLTALEVQNLEKSIKNLIDLGLVEFEDDIVNINNFNLVSNAVYSSLKKEAEQFLIKNIIARLGNGLDDTTLALLLGKLSLFKDEYLNLWKNSQFAISTGDYDAYLKNCLGFLSLIEHIEANISKEEIEKNKIDVYNNILNYLYNYSPAKIYFIENILLIDAINENNDEKIVKLSNLMLQGALISSNYTDALGLLHNILSRMKEPLLKVNDSVNAKFLLLSLIKIEILYNIGDFKQCVEIANEILSSISKENIEQIKPVNFSLNLFKSHLNDTFTIVAFAKLFMLDDDLEEYFSKIKENLDFDLSEKDIIVAIKNFLAGKTFEMGIIENYSPISKIIFLILQEFSTLKDDYKKFAQNIYQAKILAAEIHQKELEMFCDLLIGYAYFKYNVPNKAEAIYLDVLEEARKSARFNILIIVKFLLSQLKLAMNLKDEALLLMNDSLVLIQKYNNVAKIHYSLLAKQYIEFAHNDDTNSIDANAEEQNLIALKEQLSILLN